MSDQKPYIVAADDASLGMMRFAESMDEACELRDELIAELDAKGDEETEVHIYRIVE